MPRLSRHTTSLTLADILIVFNSRNVSLERCLTSLGFLAENRLMYTLGTLFLRATKNRHINYSLKIYDCGDINPAMVGGDSCLNIHIQNCLTERINLQRHVLEELYHFNNG
jgi:hypothetical protein